MNPRCTPRGWVSWKTQNLVVIFILFTCIFFMVELSSAQYNHEINKISAHLDRDSSSRAGIHEIVAFMPFQLKCVGLSHNRDHFYPSVRWQKNGHDLSVDPSLPQQKQKFFISSHHKHSVREYKRKRTESFLSFPNFSLSQQGVYGCYISNAMSPNNRIRQFSLKINNSTKNEFQPKVWHKRNSGHFESAVSAFRHKRSLYEEQRRFSSRPSCGSESTIQVNPGMSLSIPCNLGGSEWSGAAPHVDSRSWCMPNCDQSSNIKAQSANPDPAGSSGTRLKVLEDTLFISRTLLSDVGTWECKMSFINPDTPHLDYQSCFIKLIHIPKITKKFPEDDSVLVKEGSRFVATCGAESVLQTEVRWFSYSSEPTSSKVIGKLVTPKFKPSASTQNHNSARAVAAAATSMIGSPNSAVSSSSKSEDSSSRYNIITDKSAMHTSLEIFPVDSDDQKYYVCKFKTSSGEAQHVFKLTVQTKFGWLVPLVIIMVELLILATIIVSHEYWTKRRARRAADIKRHAYIPVCTPTSNRPSPLIMGTTGSSRGGGTGSRTPLGGDTLYNNYHPGNKQPANSYTTALLSSSGTLARTSLSSPSRSSLLVAHGSLKTEGERSNSWFNTPTTPSSEDHVTPSFEFLAERRPSGAVLCRASPKRVNQLQEQALMAGTYSGSGNFLNPYRKPSAGASYFGGYEC